jgi:hypothetical protein
MTGSCNEPGTSRPIASGRPPRLRQMNTITFKLQKFPSAQPVGCFPINLGIVEL